MASRFDGIRGHASDEELSVAANLEGMASSVRVSKGLPDSVALLKEERLSEDSKPVS